MYEYPGKQQKRKPSGRQLWDSDIQQEDPKIKAMWCLLVREYTEQWEKIGISEKDSSTQENEAHYTGNISNWQIKDVLFKEEC